MFLKDGVSLRKRPVWLTLNQMDWYLSVALCIILQQSPNSLFLKPKHGAGFCGYFESQSRTLFLKQGKSETAVNNFLKKKTSLYLSTPAKTLRSCKSFSKKQKKLSVLDPECGADFISKLRAKRWSRSRTSRSDGSLTTR